MFVVAGGVGRSRTLSVELFQSALGGGKSVAPAGHGLAEAFKKDGSQQRGAGHSGVPSGWEATPPSGSSEPEPEDMTMADTSPGGTKRSDAPKGAGPWPL